MMMMMMMELWAAVSDGGKTNQSHQFMGERQSESP